MKVLHFSALDGQTGAGIAAARIHNGLLARGIDSRFCAAHPSAGLQNAFTPPLGMAGRIARKAHRMLDDRMMRAAMRGYDYVLSSGASGFDIGRIVAREKPDIVQLHWIGGNSFRLASLAGLRTPVVWRLSDQWPFCGLQHLEPDAGRYRKAPPKTPSIIRPWTDISEHVRYRKLKTYRRLANLTLACPSRWLAAEARRSALFQGRPIELIPTSCDTEAFAPRERDACRQALGLPLDKSLCPGRRDQHGHGLERRGPFCRGDGRSRRCRRWPFHSDRHLRSGSVRRRRPWKAWQACAIWDRSRTGA